MMTQAEVESAVRQFVIEKFMFRADPATLKDDTSFLGAGLIDSTGVLELVMFIEETFGIRVADEDMLPENLDSVRNIGAYVPRKLGSAPVAGAA